MSVLLSCRSPAPGEPPFVKEGDRVKKGQTVCIIEAMKLMNEIEVRQMVSSLSLHAQQHSGTAACQLQLPAVQ